MAGLADNGLALLVRPHLAGLSMDIGISLLVINLMLTALKPTGRGGA